MVRSAPLRMASIMRASSATFLIQAPSFLVYTQLGGADLGGRVGGGLEWITDDHRHLILDLLRRTSSDENVSSLALAAGRLGLRGYRHGEREADLAAFRRGGIGAPVGILTEQCGLAVAGPCRRGGTGLRRLLGGGDRDRICTDDRPYGELDKNSPALSATAALQAGDSYLQGVAL